MSYYEIFEIDEFPPSPPPPPLRPYYGEASLWKSLFGKKEKTELELWEEQRREWQERFNDWRRRKDEASRLIDSLNDDIIEHFVVGKESIIERFNLMDLEES